MIKFNFEILKITAKNVFKDCTSHVNHKILSDL